MLYTPVIGLFKYKFLASAFLGYFFSAVLIASGFYSWETECRIHVIPILPFFLTFWPLLHVFLKL